MLSLPLGIPLFAKSASPGPVACQLQMFMMVDSPYGNQRFPALRLVVCLRTATDPLTASFLNGRLLHSLSLWSCVGCRERKPASPRPKGVAARHPPRWSGAILHTRFLTFAMSSGSGRHSKDWPFRDPNIVSAAEARPRLPRRIMLSSSTPYIVRPTPTSRHCGGPG